MEYITLICVIYNDGTENIHTFKLANSSDEAIRFVHEALAQYMGESNVASVGSMAVNSIGGVYKNEHWIAPVE